MVQLPYKVALIYNRYNTPHTSTTKLTLLCLFSAKTSKMQNSFGNNVVLTNFVSFRVCGMSIAPSIRTRDSLSKCAIFSKLILLQLNETTTKDWPSKYTIYLCTN